jgi:DNA (cytosine-5)-methyltransferase 1
MLPAAAFRVRIPVPSAGRDKTFCEFFAGIGLVHEALRRSGWRAVYANDIDPKKRQMCEGHYGPAPHYHLGDVWDTAAVVERIAGRPLLATASFPCTDMSLAGKRRGLAGEQSGALFGFLQVVERLADRRPPIVLLENVPGFLTSHGGADFRAAVDELAALGYWLDAFVVDARWFVPQSRPRLFLIGYHDDLASRALVRRSRNEADSDATLFDAADRDDPWRRAIKRSGRLRPARLRTAIEAIEPATGWATVDCKPPRTAEHALADFLDAGADQPWWDDHQVERHRAMLFDRHLRQIESLAAASDAPVLLTGFRRIRAGRQRLEVRFDGLAGCLRTPRGGSAKQIVLLVRRGELRMRWMTPREYARLQGAPDYTLPDNAIQAYFGFGDAVCVPAIAWIDRTMLTPVLEGAVDAARPILAR